MSQNVRDSIRAKVFKTHTRKRVKVKLFDADIELIQPTLADLRKPESEDVGVIADMLIQYARVPGTDEPVFEDTDQDMIMSWPVDNWMKDVTDAFSQLTTLDRDEAKKG